MGMALRSLVVLGVLFAASAAHANEIDSHPYPPRWIEPDPRPAQARDLFVEGQQAVLDGDPQRGLDLFEQAIALWDHPTIHFAMAQVCMTLGRARDARAHLDKVLQFPED